MGFCQIVHANCIKIKIEVKFMLVAKLDFVNHFLIANRQISCKIGKSAKNARGIFGFFYLIAYSCVFIQQLSRL